MFWRQPGVNLLLGMSWIICRRLFVWLMRVSWLVGLLVCSFVLSFARSFVCSSIRSFVRSFIHALVQLFHELVSSFFHSYVFLFAPRFGSLDRSFVCSMIPFVLSLVPWLGSFVRSIDRSFIRWLVFLIFWFVCSMIWFLRSFVLPPRRRKRRWKQKLRVVGMQGVSLLLDGIYMQYIFLFLGVCSVMLAPQKLNPVFLQHSFIFFFQLVRDNFCRLMQNVSSSDSLSPRRGCLPFVQKVSV